MEDWFKGIWSFDGRVTRREWWNGFLLLLVFVVGGWVFLFSVLTSLEEEGAAILWAILLFYVIDTYLSLALYAKRWHDLNKSGWWSLIALIPFIGPLWLLIELGFLRGTDGSNNYGPSPYGAGSTVPGEVKLGGARRDFGLCAQCGKAWQGRNAAMQASWHAKDYGHRVTLG